VSKDLITRLKKVPEVFREKSILAKLTDCPYAVKLYCTFQNETTLCKTFSFEFRNRTIRLILDFGLTYCPNGDLLQYILDAGHFELDIVRFYAAEIIEAIEQLHIRKIIHRDLKVNQIESKQLIYFISNIF